MGRKVEWPYTQAEHTLALLGGSEDMEISFPGVRHFNGKALSQYNYFPSTGRDSI